MTSPLKATPLFLVILSFLIVACGQPDWSLLCSLLTAAVGYALFWKGLLGMHRRFWLATLWFASLQALHLSWFTADKYVGLPIYLFLALLCLALGLFFGALSLLVRPPLTLPKLLAIAGAWTLFEWSRLFLLSGFSWNPVGLSLTATLYGMQLASVLGLFGLTFWVMLTNLLALKFFVERGLACASLWAAMAITPFAFGLAHVSFHRAQMQNHTEPPHAVVLVQTALAPEQKVRFPGTFEALPPTMQWHRLLRLLKEHKGKVIDLIAFSEAVVPYGTDLPIYQAGEVTAAFHEILGMEALGAEDPSQPVSNSTWAQAIADAFEAPVAVGLEDLDETGAYNAAFLFRPGQKSRERYEKRVLVPMGEYIPFNWCRRFLANYGIQDSFTPGKEAKVFSGNHPSLAMSICYEETYGHLMRESRLRGADLLVNLTNDVWYPRSRLPMVHFLHGRIRALEAGVPLVRACNTGVTCGVDSLGRTVDVLDFERSKSDSPAGALHLFLSSYTYPTLYTHFGDRIIVLFSIGMILFAPLTVIFKRKKDNLLSFSLLRKNGR